MPDNFFEKVYTYLNKRNDGKPVPLPAKAESKESGIMALYLKYEHAAHLTIGGRPYSILHGQTGIIPCISHRAEILALPHLRGGEDLAAHLYKNSFKYSVMGADKEHVFVIKDSVYCSKMGEVLEESELFHPKKTGYSQLFRPTTLSFTDKSAEYVAEGIEKVLKATPFASSGRFRAA